MIGKLVLCLSRSNSGSVGGDGVSNVGGVGKDGEVQFYSHHTQELKYSQQHKVEKFLENDCIVYDNIEKVFLCKPIAGYNTRTYTLHNKTVDRSFVCNCQGFVTSLRKTGKGSCSHVGALYESLARRHKQRAKVV